MAIYLSRRWRRQPPGTTPLDRNSPLLAAARYSYTPFFSRGLDQISLKNWTPAGASGISVAKGIAGFAASPSNYVSQVITLPPANWTLAGVIFPTVAWATKSRTIVGIVESPGANVYDRNFERDNTGGNVYRGYLYDGAAKTATSTLAPETNTPVAFAVVSAGATLKLHICAFTGPGGFAQTISVATSNNGYTGYTTPELCVGNACYTDVSTAPVDGFGTPLVLLTYDAWSDGLAADFVRNPWQVYRSERPTLYFGGAAAVTEIIGTLSSTLDAVTVSGAGTLPIVGTATPTLSDATLSAVGTLPVVGTATPTLADASLSAAATLAITGTATPTLADATVSATGTLPLVGIATPTLDDTTVAATGALAIVGTATPTLDDVTVSATGILGIVTTGALAKTLDDATVSATGVLPLVGTATPTLDAITLSAAGTAPIVGIVAPTLDAVTLTGVATIRISADLAATIADLTVSSTGLLTAAGSRIGSFAATLDDVTAAAVGTLPIAAVATPTLAAATLSATGLVRTLVAGPFGPGYGRPRPADAIRITAPEPNRTQ